MKQSFNDKEGRGRWSLVPGVGQRKNRTKHNKNYCASYAPSLSF